MTNILQRIVASAGRRPGRVIVVATLLALAGAALALVRLEPSAATETLVGKSSDTYEATETYRKQFGDHSIVILVKGDLQNIVLTSNLGRLLGLEGCIAGNRPAEVKEVPGGARGPCGRFAAEKPVQVVYGPGTFINAAVGEIGDQLQAQIAAMQREAKRQGDNARKLAKGRGMSKAEQDQAAKAASDLVQAQFTQTLLQIALRYGLSTRSTPRIDNPDFVSTLVFDPTRCATCPKARFAYLFPNQRSAVIQVRLKPTLTDAERTEAIALVREAVAMETWKPSLGVSYVVTGAPVLVADLTDELAGSLLRLLVVGLLLMALVLALVFRTRLRLLPLAVALGAVAAVFGLMALAGLPLTMASIAVLPVLLGLGVDYAIQYQARVQEDGVERAARVALPVIAGAGLATIAGFLVLLLSPVPMVRGFGALLVVGIVFAFLFALSFGTAALVRTPRGGGGSRILDASLLGAAELLAPLGRALGPVRRAGGRVAAVVFRTAIARPGRVLVIGLVFAAAGWAVDSQTEVVSDIRELVPADMPAVRDLTDLQESTDVSGEIDVIVRADDVTQPAVVKWMRDYQSGLLKRYKYSSKTGCGQAELCPALSLPDLFRSEASLESRESVRALLDAVPPYFSQAVISPDRRTAALAFGIKLMSLERQKEVIDDMRATLRPPEGVSAELAGLPVLAAEANAALSAPLRRFGTLIAGLLAVALALLLLYRRWDRAWVPLVPIALATGWSALVLFVLGVPLNPMSATLAALVIAISTEFAVLLTARYREERSAGLDVEAALRKTYASTGAAVVASGATAIAGFAVLALSDIQMLKDFGRVTVVDLAVSLLGVLAVLPAVLVIAERRAARRRVAAPEPGVVPA